ncbi:hypothetical protein PACILC2_18210 [Paenibacillus cisolokensis]|uniref:Uncharacterized protein n=1 Tax=Paenibacillus cisolokensis TaxID=1658519 RepID=A0ABQ4N4W9_9BACL|nr:hypothetical protein PACILC2_18210 [Paenibacillus cisolokensis]
MSRSSANGIGITLFTSDGSTGSGCPVRNGTKRMRPSAESGGKENHDKETRKLMSRKYTGDLTIVTPPDHDRG